MLMINIKKIGLYRLNVAPLSTECSTLKSSFLILNLNCVHAVSRTETVNLLLGNNDCTCVEMDCQGALNVAISNPDPNQVDILCPVYGDTCYSPQICHGFNEVPFFNICEVSRSSDCKLNICFGNVSEVLNNTRLDFFVSEKVICDITLYTARAYIRSFEIKGEILINHYLVGLSHK